MEIKAGSAHQFNFFIGTDADVTVGFASQAGNIVVSLAVVDAAIVAGVGTVTEHGGAGNGDGWYTYTATADETAAVSSTQLKFKATVAGGIPHRSLHDIVTVSRDELIAKIDAIAFDTAALVAAGTTLSAQQLTDIADRILSYSLSERFAVGVPDKQSLAGLITLAMLSEQVGGQYFSLKRPDNAQQWATIPLLSNGDLLPIGSVG